MSFDRFAGGARPSLGVELELQLVDAGSLALIGAIGEMPTRVPSEFRDSIKPEFDDCCVEINTGVCGDVANVERDLSAKLAAAWAAVGAGSSSVGAAPTRSPSGGTSAGPGGPPGYAQHPRRSESSQSRGAPRTPPVAGPFGPTREFESRRA